MTNIKNWKTYAFIAFVSISTLIIALQPTLTYACGGGGSHGGC